MKKRNNHVINKKFQLRFTAVGIVLSLISLSITLALFSYIAHRTTKRISEAIVKLQDAVIIENNTLELLQKNNTIVRHKTSGLLADKNNYNRYAKASRSYIALLQSINNQNRQVLIVFISLIVAQVLIMGFYFIRKTHKIAGPIYVMDKFVQNVLDGKEPEIRDLRKGDEFIDLYNKFIALYNTKIKGMRKRR